MRLSSLLVSLLYVLLLCALLWLAQGTLNNYYVRILAVMGINIILTVSLNLTNGFSGDFSLGHAAFMAIGAYASALLTLPAAVKATGNEGLPTWLQELVLPFALAVIIGGLLAALVALIVGIPVLRLRGHYLAVATLGLMVVIRVVVNNWQTVTRGARGINALPPATNIWWVYAWVVLTVYVIWRLVNSPYGRAMIAVREDEVGAATRGIAVFPTRLLAFVVGAFFAGVAGALWGHLITAITPNSFSFTVTFNVLVMLIVGGTGSISGSILGAVALTILPEALRRVETELAGGGIPLYGLSQIVIALLAALVMVFRRRGLLDGREIKLPGFL